jgi:hypothetical protein
MTDSLHVDTGEVRLLIDEDPERVLVFNPTDVLFAENFQHLRFEVEHKMGEFKAKAKELGSLPKSATEEEVIAQGNALIELRYSAISYLHSKIDDVFGKGTSQMVFGALCSEQSIVSFLEGVAPWIQVVREKKMAKYIQPPVVAKRNKHAVMK